MMRRLDGGQRCCQCQRCGTHDSFGRVSSVRRLGRSPVLSLCARRLSTICPSVDVASAEPRARDVDVVERTEIEEPFTVVILYSG